MRWLDKAKGKLVGIWVLSMLAEALGHVSPHEPGKRMPSLSPKPFLYARQPHLQDPNYTRPPWDVAEVAEVRSSTVTASVTENWEALAAVRSAGSPVTDVSSGSVR